MSEIANDYCGQPQPHAAHTWAARFGSLAGVWRYCAGRTADNERNDR